MKFGIKTIIMLNNFTTIFTIPFNWAVKHIDANDITTLCTLILAIVMPLNAEVYAGTIPYVNKTPVAQTMPIRHWYIYSWLGTHLTASGDTKIPSIASKPPLTSKPVYDRGYMLGVNTGYRFHNPFRVEGELAYQSLPVNKVDDAIGSGTTTKMKNSETTLLSFFVNGYYDFRLFHLWTPYLGLGLGYISVSNFIKPAPPVPVSPGIFFTKKTLNYATLGYQGILGVEYQLTNNAALDINYKYFFTSERKGIGKTNLGTDSYKTKQRITSNIIYFGFKYFFN